MESKIGRASINRFSPKERFHMIKERDFSREDAELFSLIALQRIQGLQDELGDPPTHDQVFKTLSEHDEDLAGGAIRWLFYDGLVDLFSGRMKLTESGRARLQSLREGLGDDGEAL